MVYLSTALKDRLGIGDEIPEPIRQSLQPAQQAWLAGNLNRGHQTLRLAVNRSDESTSSSNSQQPAGKTISHPETVLAHFVRLGPLRSEDLSIQGQNVKRNDDLILGCLGEFLSDVDVPWQTWFADDGIREATRVAENVNQMRSDRLVQANLLLAGEATGSRRMRDRVSLAGQLRCHIALVGHTGSGFNELASCIHHHSKSSANEPYVCLDASLMDAELLEAYASPAIDPLSHSRETKTTLCLQRFDEMPDDGQARLVEWLKTWPDRLRLIGLLSPHFIPTEVVERRNGGNGFASELADAMSVFAIQIPTLASRKTDLAILAQSLVDMARLSRDAIELIENYPWPGQWDEMIAAMKFASQAVRGERVTREHLPLAIRSYRHGSIPTVAIERTEQTISIRPKTDSPDEFQIESLDETLRAYEKTLIEKALFAADGNKAEAARRLGISRSRLLRKLADE